MPLNPVPPHRRSPQLAGYHTLRSAVLSMLGGRCVECGHDDIRVLEINHVHNDGYLLVRENGPGRRVSSGLTYKHLRLIRDGEDPLDRYEALCANCHALRTKGYI